MYRHTHATTLSLSNKADDGCVSNTLRDCGKGLAEGDDKSRED